MAAVGVFHVQNQRSIGADLHTPRFAGQYPVNETPRNSVNRATRCNGEPLRVCQDQYDPSSSNSRTHARHSRVRRGNRECSTRHSDTTSQALLDACAMLRSQRGRPTRTALRVFRPASEVRSMASRLPARPDDERQIRSDVRTTSSNERGPESSSFRNWRLARGQSQPRPQRICVKWLLSGALG